VEPPWSVNSGFIVGEHTTLIVDTGSNYLSAQTIFGYSSCAKPDNKLMVVNTEPHFDHIGGNGFFIRKNIDVYAHPGVKRNEEEFKQNKEEFNSSIPNAIRRNNQEAEIFFYKTELVNPNKALSQNEIIDLGGFNVTVLNTPGHTAYNISLFASADGVLYCGDCIVTGYIPNLEAGHISDWETWLKSIETLENLNPEIIVTGHGYCIVGSEQINKELINLRNILNKAIKDKKAPTQLS
jgi:glyoxylase-like metal-dependent hydrolase (beta-lactamase superfamily II)